MEAKLEMEGIIQRIWAKLQGLPDANALEIGAFFILILFVATFVMLIVLSCIHCCCCGKPKYQASRIQPV